MKIIVVYGDKNTGKTTVINEIYENLVKNGALVKISKTRQGANVADFDAELSYCGKSVVLMSMGDAVGPVMDVIRKCKD